MIYPTNVGILLAKSLQGDKPTRYYTLWLSLSGYKSYCRPVWRHNATRFSRKGYAPATSPTVSECFLVRAIKLAEDVQILSRAKRGRHPRSQGPCRKDGSILMFYGTCRETVIALIRSAVLGARPVDLGLGT